MKSCPELATYTLQHPKSTSTVEVVSLLTSAKAATQIVFLGVGNLKAQPLLRRIILQRKKGKIHSAVVALGGRLIDV